MSQGASNYRSPDISGPKTAALSKAIYSVFNAKSKQNN